MWRDTLRYDDALLASLRRVYGDDLEKFLNAITIPSRRLYLRVNILKIDPDTLIERLRQRGIEVYRDEHLFEAVYIPVKGPFNVNDLGRYVYVDKYAAESVLLGADLYVPGVVACDEDVKRGSEVSVVAPNGMVIAEGIAMMSCDEMKRLRKGLAVKIVRSVYKAPSLRELPEYNEGLFYPQSLPAMYVTHVLDPRPGEVVVDMCAAPGGKTTHIVELSRGRAIVLAFDHSRKKIQEMIKELLRLGHAGLVEVWRADSRYLHVDFPWIRADKILVDPPCTALGVRPKVLDEKRYSDIINTARYQYQFLEAAYRLSRPGTIIVYSTCTVTIEENEELIEKFVAEHRCIEVERIDMPLASRGVYGVFADYYARFHPHIHDVTGYFIAKLRKTCA